ncbi:phosphatidylserine/phosphatidylglycerophosphate/cardiolipin synthase family protein [Parasphingorhabdus flavimaris]|uniref:phospholipase D-like domain-containing protein n=1 Tax=Parasphingorhabdus flavimaris TaxID=266812 RepID=UPI0030037512
MEIPTGNNPISYADPPQWCEVGGNRLRLVRVPSVRLAALIDLLESAQNSLKLFFYMFEDDRTGRQILDILVAACDRGVKVEMMIDSFGSNGAPRKFFAPLIEAGGKFKVFSPNFSSSYFVRNHQKMIIADDGCALIGGFNIADEYFSVHRQNETGDSTDDSWEDLGLEIAGPEVRNLANYYRLLSDWVYRDNGNIRSLQKMVRDWEAGDGQFRWLLGGPSNRLSRWARAIKNDLENASRLDLVSAYFSPGQGLLRRIAKISKRGGKSRIILPGETDNAATIGASRLLYGYLLKRHARIFEYQPRRLHTKLVIVDDAVYVGSANFDLRSLFINVEIMLRIEDAGFARHASGVIDALHEDSQAITPDLHKSRRSFLNRLRWIISYFFVNTLDYSVTRRLNFGIKK